MSDHSLTHPFENGHAVAETGVDVFPVPITGSETRTILGGGNVKGPLPPAANACPRNLCDQHFSSLVQHPNQWLSIVFSWKEFITCLPSTCSSGICKKNTAVPESVPKLMF